MQQFNLQKCYSSWPQINLVRWTVKLRCKSNFATPRNWIAIREFEWISFWKLFWNICFKDVKERNLETDSHVSNPIKGNIKYLWTERERRNHIENSNIYNGYKTIQHMLFCYSPSCLTFKDEIERESIV